MPQMMPLNWLLLMLFFIMILYMFNNLNFFNLNYTTQKEKINKKLILFTWKW
uniref:ATP synthase complex subunit 8 n=1 Tax=Apteropeda orbiculata TaxID=467478 RepID=A0A3G1GT38_9CUCU|nr:ATP synthase F0 subunit 8 [Apteropeda orbiculata]